MTDVLGASIVPGLGLGAVLAAGAAWSRASRSGPLPHLAVGAWGGLGVIVAVRFQGRPGLFVLLVVAGAGALAAAGALLLERRLRTHALPGLGDLAVLGAVAAAVSLLAPLTAVPLPFGPLGGVPGTAGGVGALLVGGAGAAVVVRFSAAHGPAGHPRRGPAVWVVAVAGAAVAAAAALAAGATTGSSPTMGILVGLPDTVGLAVRVAAAALAGRRGPADAAAAGLGLGVVESLLRVLDPLGGSSLLPAAGAALLGLALVGVDVRRRAVSGMAVGANT